MFSQPNSTFFLAGPLAHLAGLLVQAGPLVHLARRTPTRACQLSLQRLALSLSMSSPTSFSTMAFGHQSGTAIVSSIATASDLKQLEAFLKPFSDPTTEEGPQELPPITKLEGPQELVTAISAAVERAQLGPFPRLDFS